MDAYRRQECSTEGAQSRHRPDPTPLCESSDDVQDNLSRAQDEDDGCESLVDLHPSWGTKDQWRSMAVYVSDENQILYMLLFGRHHGEYVLTVPFGYKSSEDIVAETELQQLRYICDQ